MEALHPAVKASFGRARSVAAAVVATAILAAAGCAADDAPEGGEPLGPGGRPVDPGPGVLPVDPGKPRDPPPPAPPSPPRCTRDVQAKTAPVSLWDAFSKDIVGLAGTTRTARVDKLLADVAAQGGTPLEDPSGDRVVFLVRGASPSGAWRVVGSFVAWDKAQAVAMQPVPDTDLWAVETKIPRGASYQYKLLVSLDDAGFREDALAKNVVWDGIDRGFGKKGEFNAVGHPGDQPKEKGRLVWTGKLRATKLGNDRDVWVYFPARYDDGKCEKLPSVVFHDGMESLTRGAFATEADALYAARPDLSAVLAFVGLPDASVRMQEYSFGFGDSKGAEYVDFVTEELWPRLAKDHRLCGKPAARGISGASLGGLISTFAAFEKPASWGWVGAQSASYFWNDRAMIQRVDQTPKIPVRFYLDSGCPGDNCDVTDEMAAVMAKKGYDHVRIKETNGQHEWSFWRARLGGMLTHFRDKQIVCD